MLRRRFTTANERRIKRWEHEHVVEAVQTRLDQNPQVVRVRRETVEHPFATLKMRMGATHFLMKRLPNVATEMALSVPAMLVSKWPTAPITPTASWPPSTGVAKV